MILEQDMADARRAAPMLEVRGLDVYYGSSHALQGVDLTLDSGVLSVVGRNGMGKTTLCKTIMGLVRATGGSVRLSGEDLLSLQPAQVARLGVGYVPQGRRLWRSLTVDEHLRMIAGQRRGAWTVGAHLRHVPAAGRAQEQWRRPALRRRAADAGDRARAGDQSASADHGRADRRPGACHRRTGRGHAGTPRRRRRHFGTCRRAEHRRGDDGLQERRDHGQRPGQSPDRVLASCRRPRSATAPARRRASFGNRIRDQCRGRFQRCRAPHSRASGEFGAAARVYIQSDAADPLVAARADRTHRGRRTDALERRVEARRSRTAAT